MLNKPRPMTFAIAGLRSPGHSAGTVDQDQRWLVPAAEWLAALVALEKGFVEKKGLDVVVAPIKLAAKVTLNQLSFFFYARMSREV